MARKGAQGRQGAGQPAQAPQAPQATGTTAVTLVEAQLDVAGAVAAHGELLEALSTGAVRIDLSEGKPTQPAIQLIVAARNSARSGHDITFSERAEALLSTVIEEDLRP